MEKRYRHLHRARQIYEHGSASRLELQARILSRQNDAEIAYHVGLEPAAVQAYRDIYYMLGDRLESSSYVMFQVIGIKPLDPPTPVMLMQMCAYVHGPLTIEPWLQYLKEGAAGDLRSSAGRDSAAIELVVAAHALPTADQAPLNMVKQVPILLENRWNSAAARSAGAAFRQTTSEIIRDLDLSPVQLAPLSYGPLDDTVTEQGVDGCPPVSRGAA